jgi:hypothetical protein
MGWSITAANRIPTCSARSARFDYYRILQTALTPTASRLRHRKRYDAKTQIPCVPEHLPWPLRVTSGVRIRLRVCPEWTFALTVACRALLVSVVSNDEIRCAPWMITIKMQPLGREVHFSVVALEIKTRQLFLVTGKRAR